MTQVPGVYYRLVKQDRTTRVLANPQLRSQVGYSAQAQFGDRVPVPVTTFSPIATGGVNQQPITSFNYENIGVNIDITPRTHMNNEVTLALTIQVTSISGTGFGGLPTFGNRLIKTTIRLKDGETNMLAGLIRDDERKIRDGIPGLSDIPGIGHLLGHSSNERQSDRRHRHADAAHRARARADRRGPARVPDGPGCRSRRHHGRSRRRTRRRRDAPAAGSGTHSKSSERCPTPRQQPGGLSSRRSRCCRRRRSHKRRPTPGKRPHRVRHASGAACRSWRVAALMAHVSAIHDRTGRYTYDQLDRASAAVALRLLDGRDDL